MGIFHIDPECDQLIQKLADSLTSFERQTGRQNALIFLPCSPDENVVVLINGKMRDPLEDSPINTVHWAQWNRNVLRERNKA